MDTVRFFYHFYSKSKNFENRKGKKSNIQFFGLMIKNFLQISKNHIL